VQTEREAKRLPGGNEHQKKRRTKAAGNWMTRTDVFSVVRIRLGLKEIQTQRHEKQVKILSYLGGTETCGEKFYTGQKE